MSKTRKNLSNQVKTKIRRKQSKRLQKLYKDPENVWGKNKNLEKFWYKLASGNEVLLIYNNDEIENYTMPKTKIAASKKYRELLNNNNIKAIITSAMSSDTYESLYKRVKNNSPNEIIKNYKKYLINLGDKEWYL